MPKLLVTFVLLLVLPGTPLAADFDFSSYTRLLQRQGERLARQPAKGLRIDRKKNLVYVSKIFDFDEVQFAFWAGGAIPFLLPDVTNPADRSYLETGRFRLNFLDYNWTLNDTRSADPP